LPRVCARDRRSHARSVRRTPRARSACSVRAGVLGASRSSSASSNVTADRSACSLVVSVLSRRCGSTGHSPRRRIASTARFLVIVSSHVTARPLRGSYASACRHARRKASCATSSAIADDPTSDRQAEDTGLVSPYEDGRRLLISSGHAGEQRLIGKFPLVGYGHRHQKGSRKSESLPPRPRITPETDARRGTDP
jgi:hypothetical protein